MQTAVVEALTTWRRDGPPDNPAAWLQVAARRNALDAVRRSTRQRALAARAPAPAEPSDGNDDRLALLFGCCHPALAPEARLALTLRAVVGLTTPQIARGFLVSEATLAQRIARAKRKTVTAGISLAVPTGPELPARLADVLAVVYVMFNEGFVSSTGPTQDRDLAADAIWLAGTVATSLPREAEAWGLAALAVALAHLGPDHARRALADVDALGDPLASYHLLHATRAELLRMLGRPDEAAAAGRRALALTSNAAEQRLLTTRLHRYPLSDGS